MRGDRPDQASDGESHLPEGHDPDKTPVQSESLEEAAEYGAALASEFPGGSVVARIIEGVVRKRQNRRLNGFLLGLQKDIHELGDRINDNFMESEEYADLVEEIASKAADTRQEEKLDAYRNLFLNTVTADDPSFDDAAEISNLVARWQPIHILFLRDLLQMPYTRSNPNLINQEPSEGAVRHEGLKTLARRLEWEAENVRRIWFELRASGVVKESTRRERRWDEDRIDMEFRISNFGKRVVDFLSEPEEADED